MKKRLFQQTSQTESGTKFKDYYICESCLDLKSINHDPAASGGWFESPFAKCDECHYVDDEAQTEYNEWLDGLVIDDLRFTS